MILAKKLNAARFALDVDKVRMLSVSSMIRIISEVVDNQHTPKLRKAA